MSVSSIPGPRTHLESRGVVEGMQHSEQLIQMNLTSILRAQPFFPVIQLHDCLKGLLPLVAQILNATYWDLESAFIMSDRQEIQNFWICTHNRARSSWMNYKCEMGSIKGWEVCGIEIFDSHQWGLLTLTIKDLKLHWKHRFPVMQKRSNRWMFIYEMKDINGRAVRYWFELSAEITVARERLPFWDHKIISTTFPHESFHQVQKWSQEGITL
jgi:hypothetical protein